MYIYSCVSCVLYFVCIPCLFLGACCSVTFWLWCHGYDLKLKVVTVVMVCCYLKWLWSCYFHCCSCKREGMDHTFFSIPGAEAVKKLP